MAAAARPRATRTLARLPRDVRGEARDTVAAPPRVDAIPRGTPPRVAGGRGRARERAARGLRRGAAPLRRSTGRMLAAVNFVESAFGRVRSASEAGARGPMQFLPATWRGYGLGGDIDDPRDAILARGGFLHAQARRSVSTGAVRLQPLDRLRARGQALRGAHARRTSGAFRTYYAWQVYVRTPRRRRRAAITGPGPRMTTAPSAAGRSPLALPLVLVILLRAAPALDVRWEVDPVHFWIVLTAGVANAALAIAISEAGRRRRDARLLLIGLAFLVSAGFLGLHALATPNVVVDGGSAGFVLATPIGLVAGGRVRGGLGGRVQARGVAADRPHARALLARRARDHGPVGGHLGGRAAAAARPGHARQVQAPLRSSPRWASCSTATRRSRTSASGGAGARRLAFAVAFAFALLAEALIISSSRCRRAGG